MRLVLAAFLAALPAASGAGITVDFRESAPKDSFTISNTSECDLTGLRVQIDLSTAAAGLIFDVTADGAGVEVFQPFEVVQGTAAPRVAVRDGDTVIDLDLAGLAPGETVRFTIDVDDTLTEGALGQIRVADSEMVGATVRVIQGSTVRSALFDGKARSVVEIDGCVL